MRILLCINNDFLGNWALNQLKPILQTHEFDLILSDQVSKNAVKASQITDRAMFEKQIVQHALFPLLNQQKPQQDLFWSFDQWANRTQSRTIQQFASINKGNGLAFVQQFQPDVILSIRFGMIFKNPVIAIPQYGILNLHSAILPDYRGILGTFWAMLDSKQEIGCTLHYINDDTIDTGDIVGIYRQPTAKQESVLSNLALLYQGSAMMIGGALDQLSNSIKPPTTNQDPSQGRYFSYPQQLDVERFIKQGGCLYKPNDCQRLFMHYGVKDKAVFDQLIGIVETIND